MDSTKAPVAYLATPYSHSDHNIQRIRFLQVTWMASELLRQNIYTYSPITHNIAMNAMGIFGDFKDWMSFDHSMLERCDRLLVLQLQGWEDSKGVAAEIACAKELGMPIEYLEAPAHMPSYQDSDPQNPLITLISRYKQMCKEREWEAYHSPKNLTMDLTSEAGEIADLFRWLTEEESWNLSEKTHNKVAQEIGDVQIALLALSTQLKLDPLQCASQKIEEICKKYPVDKSKGKIDKYDSFEPEASSELAKS